MFNWSALRLQAMLESAPGLAPLAGPFKAVSYIDVELRLSVLPSDESHPHKSAAAMIIHNTPENLKFAGKHRESLLVRFYYPVAKESDHHQIAKTSMTAAWMPSPEIYHEAYGSLLKWPWFVSRAVSRFLLGSVRVPGVFEGLDMINEREEGVEELILFSHGLGAIRTTNTSYCAQMASFGYIVAAVEHRDGSAGVTIAKSGSLVIPYEHVSLPEKETEESEEEQMRKDFEAIQETECKNRADSVCECTVRRHQEHWRRKAASRLQARYTGRHAWRHSQLAHRASELLTLADLFRSEKRQNARELFEWSPQRHSSDRIESILDSILGRCIKKIHVTGHSFGGATALYTASLQPSWFQSCIAMDPWMYPMPVDDDSWWKAVGMPERLLIVMSEAFDAWPENSHSIQRLLAKIGHFHHHPKGTCSSTNGTAKEDECRHYYFRLRGSVHQDFADFPAIVQPWILEFVRSPPSRIHPHKAMLTCVHASRALMREGVLRIEKRQEKETEDPMDLADLVPPYHAAPHRTPLQL